MYFTSNNTFVIGGAYSLEDGLAPSGGEGWAPPRAYGYVCFVLSNTVGHHVLCHVL